MDVRTRRLEQRSQLAPVRGRNRVLATLSGFAALCLASCGPLANWPLPGLDPGDAQVEDTALERRGFAELPGWAVADLAPALAAFQNTCDAWSGAPDDAPVSRRAPYGGVAADWRPACDAAAQTADARVFFETQFAPFEIAPNAAGSKLTGYFEPALEARRQPEPGFEAAIPGPPSDLVTVELGVFDASLAPRRFWGRVADGRLGLYPARKDIVDEPARALAFADAADVYYLQIQGSGRVTLPGGETFRAAFAAHNSRPFRSIARYLIDAGEITRAEAGISGVKSWIRSADPEAARTAMNDNPRYVWFRAEPLTDPDLGPRGAQGVPLTPMASLAVDPAFHPYGAPIYLDTLAPTRAGDWKGAPFQSLLIAQDTGGAIKGVRRGDLFFGWGDEAGGRAASMNHELSMWVLLPVALADRMAAEAGADASVPEASQTP